MPQHKHAHNLSAQIFGHQTPMARRLFFGLLLLLIGTLAIHLIESGAARICMESLGCLLQGMGITPYLDKLSELAEEA